MTDSILDSVKLALDIAEDDTAFDQQLLMHINSVFSVLHQVGASPAAGFSILDNTATWQDFIQDVQHVNMVKTYVVLRVRLIFDPPGTSYLIESLKIQADQLEWRLNLLENLFVQPPTEPPAELPAGFAYLIAEVEP